MRRSDVLVECDRHDSLGHACQQSALVRLQDRAHRGEYLDANDHTTIRRLMEKLKIQSTKHVSVATGLYERESFFLTMPLGPYYTKLTVPHKIIQREEVTREWDNNPIELVEVFDIVSKNNLSSEKMHETPVVSLHFKKPNLAEMLGVLIELKLQDCKTLEIRNLQIQPTQIPALKSRMNWPKLTTIILKG